MQLDRKRSSELLLHVKHPQSSSDRFEEHLRPVWAGVGWCGLVSNPALPFETLGCDVHNMPVNIRGSGVRRAAALGSVLLIGFLSAASVSAIRRWRTWFCDPDLPRIAPVLRRSAIEPVWDDESAAVVVLEPAPPQVT